MSIKIPAGLQALVHVDKNAINENRERNRAGGTRFAPPWWVWVRGPVKKLPRGAAQTWQDNVEPDMGVAVYPCFSFDGNVKPKYAIDKFPYAWAPRPLQAVNAWMETSTGLVLSETLTEETSNG